MATKIVGLDMGTHTVKVCELVTTFRHYELVGFGVEPVGGSTADYAALIKQQTALWQKLITDLKIKLD